MYLSSILHTPLPLPLNPLLYTYPVQYQNRNVSQVSNALRAEFARGDGRVKKKEDERRKKIVPNETLFVVNFHEETTKREDLQMLFEPYGELVRIDMKRNYAFVQFKTVEEAIRAKEATNGGKLDQSEITVEFVARRMGEGGGRRDRGDRGGGGRRYDDDRGEFFLLHSNVLVNLIELTFAYFIQVVEEEDTVEEDIVMTAEETTVMIAEVITVHVVGIGGTDMMVRVGSELESCSSQLSYALLFFLSMFV